jgi:hypothetical protein
MGEEQYRSVIRFLFLEGKSPCEIKERLDVAYGNFSFDGDRQNLVNEFQRDRISVFNEPRPDAPKTATTE